MDEQVTTKVDGLKNMAKSMNSVVYVQLVMQMYDKQLLEGDEFWTALGFCELCEE